MRAIRSLRQAIEDSHLRRIETDLDKLEPDSLMKIRQLVETDDAFLEDVIGYYWEPDRPPRQWLGRVWFFRLGLVRILDSYRRVGPWTAGEIGALKNWFAARGNWVNAVEVFEAATFRFRRDIEMQIKRLHHRGLRVADAMPPPPPPAAPSPLSSRASTPVSDSTGVPESQNMLNHLAWDIEQHGGPLPYGGPQDDDDEDEDDGSTSDDDDHQSTGTDENSTGGSDEDDLTGDDGDDSGENRSTDDGMELESSGAESMDGQS